MRHWDQEDRPVLYGRRQRQCTHLKAHLAWRSPRTESVYMQTAVQATDHVREGSYWLHMQHVQAALIGHRPVIVYVCWINSRVSKTGVTFLCRWKESIPEWCSRMVGLFYVNSAYSFNAQNLRPDICHVTTIKIYPYILNLSYRQCYTCRPTYIKDTVLCSFISVRWILDYGIKCAACLHVC